MSKAAVMEQFAKRMGISVHQARRLQTLVNKAADAQVEEHNTGTDSAAACKAVDEYALKLNLGVDWRPGIYPLFINGSNRENVPD